MRGKEKRSGRSGSVGVGVATAVEPLEPRAYLTIAFDGGRDPIGYPTNSVAVGLTVGQFNTGNLDLGVSYTNSTFVQLGQGNGSFTSGPQGVSGTSTVLRTGDMNDDGALDIHVQGESNNIVGFVGNGGGSLTTAGLLYDYGAGSVFDFTTADITGDGFTDIIATGSNGLSVQENNQDFTYTTLFSRTNQTFRPCVQAIDVNNDGRRDIIVGTTDGTVNSVGVYLQDTNGLYNLIKKSTLTRPAVQIRAGFFNTDSILDLAVLEQPNTGESDATVDLMMGKGDGTFSRVASPHAGAATAIATADFDLDGRTDVVVTRNLGSGSSFSVLRTAVDGTLDRFYSGSGTAATDLIEWGDFNNDSKPDVVVRQISDGHLALYLNTATKQNSIRGLLWNDVNQNQVRDAGESAHPGSTIYDDVNDNGVFDAGEASATTLADGRYELRVNDGTHRVRLKPDPGWIQTYPYTAPNVSKSQAHLIGTTGGNLYTNYNFGTFDGGDIQGSVFNDSNANQNFDLVESGVPGVTVFLDTNNNNLLDVGEPSTTTNAQGRYKFNVTGNGTFNVRTLPTSGWSNTTPQPRMVSAGPNTPAVNVNLGRTMPAKISGRVYYDFAANGRVDESEDVGVGGLQVFLDLNNNNALDAGEPSTTSSTSADPAIKGHYEFTGRTPGYYYVRVVKPAGYKQIAPVGATGPGSAGPFYTFAFGGADTSYTDFGLIQPVVVSGKVFRDSDADGVFDVGSEKGLGDVAVFIDYDGDGSGDTNEPYALSNGMGDYTLTSTRQGTFNVRAIRPSGFNSTIPSSSLYAVTFTYGAPATTGKNFGLREGAFNTSPYNSPINVPTGSNPTALAAGDFNGDSKQDFIVASNSGTSQVYLGQNNGTFMLKQEFSIGDSTRYMIAVDVSGDGKPDLVAANEALDFGASVLISNGDGTFKSAVGYAVTTNTYGVAAADFTGDGKKDLAYVGTTDGRVAILINKGDGTFNNATFVTNTGSLGGKSVIAGDVNNDSKQDLVVANNSNDSLSVFLGAGNGTFTKVATNVTGGVNLPNFVTLADFNSDGKLDVAVLNELAEDIRVKLGNGNGTFAAGQSYGTGPTPTQVAVLDIDRDGNLDLIASCRSDGTTDISGDVSIHRGRGDGTFVDRQIRTAHTSPTAVAIADYNSDGKLDIVAANFFSDDVSLLINGTPGALCNIEGIVWNDADNDGVRDAGETAMEGQTVFDDSNNNGTFDPGERFTRTASGGFYVLGDLPAATYRLRVVVPATMVQTSPANRAAQVVTLAAGQDAGALDLGMVPIFNSAGAYVFDDRSTLLTGTWVRTTGTGQLGGDYLHDGNTAKGTKSARWDLKLPAAGYYQVAMRWVSGADRASNAPVDIVTANGTRTLTVDQRINGGNWQPLGVYFFNPTGGMVTLRTTNTSGYVVADGVRLLPVSAPPTVTKDNADASGVTISGPNHWLTQTSPIGFNGPNYLVDGNPAVKGGRSVKFTPALTFGGVYEVFGRWVALPDRATNARYDILTASGQTTTVFANQQTRNGEWVSLGFFALNPATASVTIRNDGANGMVVADAVRFVLVG